MGRSLGVFCAVVTCIGGACRPSASPPPATLEPPTLAAQPAAEQVHESRSPHGGELIALGGAGSPYGLEVTVDRATGTLDLRVLQGAEEVPISQPSITAVIETPAAQAGLTIALFPVMPLTIGSRVGSASLFRAHAPELRQTGDISGRLVEITIENSEFKDIAFVQPADNLH